MAARRRRQSTTYQLKLKVQQTAGHLLWSLMLFLGIMLITGGFILFQWKDVTIRTYLREIDLLNLEISKLYSVNSELRARRNELIKQVPEVAQKKLGMIFPGEGIPKLKVDVKKLAYYEKKDHQVPK